MNSHQSLEHSQTAVTMINIGSAILTITPQLQELIQCKSVIARGGSDSGIIESRVWTACGTFNDFEFVVHNDRMFYVQSKWYLNSKSIVIGNLIVGTCWSHQTPSTEYVGYIDTLLPGPAKFIPLSRVKDSITAFRIIRCRNNSAYIRNNNGYEFIFNSKTRVLTGAGI